MLRVLLISSVVLQVQEVFFRWNLQVLWCLKSTHGLGHPALPNFAGADVSFGLWTVCMDFGQGLSSLFFQNQHKSSKFGTWQNNTEYARMEKPPCAMSTLMLVCHSTCVKMKFQPPQTRLNSLSKLVFFLSSWHVFIKITETMWTWRGCHTWVRKND